MGDDVVLSSVHSFTPPPLIIDECSMWDHAPGPAGLPAAWGCRLLSSPLDSLPSRRRQNLCQPARFLFLV